MPVIATPTPTTLEKATAMEETLEDLILTLTTRPHSGRDNYYIIYKYHIGSSVFKDNELESQLDRGNFFQLWVFVGI